MSSKDLKASRQRPTIGHIVLLAGLKVTEKESAFLINKTDKFKQAPFRRPELSGALFDEVF